MGRQPIGSAAATQVARRGEPGVERVGRERRMTASEADRQLVAMHTAAHSRVQSAHAQRPGSWSVAMACRSRRLAITWLIGSSWGPRHTAERSRQSGRIAGPHAAQVVVQLSPLTALRPVAPWADLPLQFDPAGRAGPAGRQGDLDRISRRIGQLEVAASGEPSDPSTL